MADDAPARVSSPRRSGGLQAAPMMAAPAPAPAPPIPKGGRSKPPRSSAPRGTKREAGTLDRKTKKNSREKARRLELNQRYDTLTTVLGLEPRTDKTAVLDTAINTIASLRRENGALCGAAPFHPKEAYVRKPRGGSGGADAWATSGGSSPQTSSDTPQTPLLAGGSPAAGAMRGTTPPAVGLPVASGQVEDNRARVLAAIAARPADDAASIASGGSDAAQAVAAAALSILGATPLPAAALHVPHR